MKTASTLKVTPKLSIILVLFCLSPLLADVEQNDIESNQLPDVFFIENLGQWDHPFEFKAPIGESILYVETDGLLYSLIDQSTMPCHGQHHGDELQTCEQEQIKGHAYRQRFLNANDEVRIRGQFRKKTYHNYFLGNNPEKWKGNVGLFSEIIYDELYSGIDLHYYQKDGALKYDFVVAPRADVDQIKIKYEGLDDIKIINNALHLITSVQNIIEKKPIAYQVINGVSREITCEYRLADRELSFYFPNGYDQSKELLIDPELVFSTYSGSTAGNFGHTATFDADENGYGGGVVFDLGYPTTTGAFQTNFADGNQDVNITKFNATGTDLIYSTYLGGSSREWAHSMIVNDDNELIVFGSVRSDDFPVSSNAHDRQLNSSSGPLFVPTDIFITKFNQDGTDIVGSTYLGGDDDDGQNEDRSSFALNYADEYRGEVVIGENDQIIIASNTASIDFPTTPSAFQPNYGGGRYDAVISAFNSDLSSLEWSTFYGGSESDVASSMKIDDQYNVYFTGGTSSTDLPITASAINPNYLGGRSDGFIGRLNKDGSSLLSSTYLGTDHTDFSYILALDQAGSVHVIGNALGNNYAITAGHYVNAASSNFIHKLKPSLDSTYFSSQFGTSSRLAMTALMVDNCDRIYLSGWGGGLNSGQYIFNYPVTADAFQPNTLDGEDFYFAVFTPNFFDLEYATYFGGERSGEHVDGGTSRFDSKGVIYQAICAACSGNNDLPTTPNAYSTRSNAGSDCNMAVVKFDFQLNQINTTSVTVSGSETSGCSPLTVSFDHITTGPVAALEWYFDDNGQTSTMERPVHTFDTPGEYTVLLIATSQLDCVDPDTAYLTINVLPNLPTIFERIEICDGDSIQISSSELRDSTTYTWNTNETTSSIDVDQSGTFWVETISPDGCFTDSFEVVFDPSLSSSTNTFLCDGDNQTLRPIDAGDNYLWSDGSTSDSLIVSTVGVYWVDVLGAMRCATRDSFIVNLSPGLTPNIYNLDLCSGASIILLPTDTGTQFAHTWNDGSTSNNLVIGSAGTYWVETSAETRCPLRDSFIVNLATTLNPSVTNFSLCAGQSLALMPSVTGMQYVHTWNDNSTNATLDIDRSGVYYVLTEEIGGCSVVDSFVVIPQAATPPTNTTVERCNVETIQLFATHTNDVVSHQWQDGSTGDTLFVNQAGVYWVQTTSDEVCNLLDTFIVVNAPRTSPVASNIALCDDDMMTLSSSAQSTSSTYVWEDGSSEANLTISEPGVYWVITNSDEVCNLVDSFIVSLLSPPDPTSEEITLCEGSTLRLSSQYIDAGINYIWSDGSVDSINDISTGGEFEVTTLLPSGCSAINYFSVTEIPVPKAEDFYFPNAFSPNDDGVNDDFGPYFNENSVDILSYDLRIFNRWGQQIFNSNDVDRRWNGHADVRTQNVDVYVWVCEMSVSNCDENLQQILMHGDVVIVK